MGLQRWNTTEYVGVVITAAEVVSIIKEMANLLAEHTSGTLTETTDTASTYQGVVDFGDMAFQFYANATSTTSISVQTKMGYVNGGAFTAVGDSASHTITINSYLLTNANVAVLYVVDNGEYVEMQYRLGASSGSSMILRFVRLTSSLDVSVKRRCAYVMNYSGRDPYSMYGLSSANNFRFINGLGSGVTLTITNPSALTLTYIVGPPKVVMYPSLFAPNGTGYYMGIPTIGGKRIYVSNANIRAGIAYFVENTQYLSLGDYHIVNT